MFYATFTGGRIVVWPVGVRVMRAVGSLRTKLSTLETRKGGMNLIPAVNTLRTNRTSLIGHYITRGSTTMMDIFMGPARFGSGGSLIGCPHAPRTSYYLLRRYKTTFIFTPSIRRVCPRPSTHHFDCTPLSAIVRKTFHPKRFGNIYRVIDGLFSTIRPSHTCFNRGSFRRLTVVHRVIHRVGCPLRVMKYPVIHRRSKLTLDDHGTHLSTRRHGGTLGVSRALFRDHAFKTSRAMTRARGFIRSAVTTTPKLHLRCFRLISNGALRGVAS